MALGLACLAAVSAQYHGGYGGHESHGGYAGLGGYGGHGGYSGGHGGYDDHSHVDYYVSIYFFGLTIIKLKLDKIWWIKLTQIKSSAWGPSMMTCY